MSAFRKIDYRDYGNHAVYKQSRPVADEDLTKDLTETYIAQTRDVPARDIHKTDAEATICESFQQREGGQPVYDPTTWDPAVALEVHMRHDRGLRDGVSFYQGDNKGGLSESEAFSGVTQSKFHHELMRNIELGSQRQCELASFGLSECVPTLNIGCQNTIMTTRPHLGDWLRTAKKLESTKFLKMDDMNCVRMLRPEKAKIAFALCREDLCNPTHSMAVDLMNNMSVMADIRKERQLADLFFNIGPIDADGNIRNRVPFIFNERVMNTYIPVGATSQPWQNHIMGDPYNSPEGTLFPCPQRCNIDMRTVFDKLDEDRRDLSGTCLPLDCEIGPMRILTGSQQAMRRLSVVLGPKLVEYCMQREDGCKGTFSQQESGRDDLTMKYSKWFRERYISWSMASFTSSHPNRVGKPLTRNEAISYLECTYWIGRPEGFAAYLQEWEFETFDRGSLTDANTTVVTSENFDKEIIGMRKAMVKSAAGVTDPTQGTLVQAVPHKAA